METLPSTEKNGIVLTLTKQPNTDTLKITKAVENAIAEISKTLPEKVELKIVYRQDDFINTAISNVEDAIRDGAIMVFVILFIFGIILHNQSNILLLYAGRCKTIKDSLVSTRKAFVSFPAGILDTLNLP